MIIKYRSIRKLQTSAEADDLALNGIQQRSYTAMERNSLKNSLIRDTCHNQNLIVCCQSHNLPLQIFK